VSRVQGLGFRVRGLGFNSQGSGFRVQGQEKNIGALMRLTSGSTLTLIARSAANSEP
jgi:hypothetical protein